MPIKKVKGGYKWGNYGKVYPTRKQAEKQAAAAYANGYKGYEDGGVVVLDVDPRKDALQKLAKKEPYPMPTADNFLSQPANQLGDIYNQAADYTKELGKKYVTDPIVEKMSLEQAIPDSMPEAKKSLKRQEQVVSRTAADIFFDPIAMISGLGAAAKAGRIAPEIAAKGKQVYAELKALRDAAKAGKWSDDIVRARQAKLVEKNKDILQQIDPGTIYQIEKMPEAGIRSQQLGPAKILSDDQLKVLRETYKEDVVPGDLTIPLIPKAN